MSRLDAGMDLRERTANPHRHPWELSRADMVLRLVNGQPSPTTYADVGSGDLYFARRLQRETNALVYAIDVNYQAQSIEGELVICTDLNQVPSASVDCALLMDVLEHAADDAALLHAVQRILAPAGRVLITVPAHDFLWSQHDVFLGHYRRYNRETLTRLLRHGQLDPIECFYFYSLPFFARACSVAITAFSRAIRLRWREHPAHASAIGLWRYSSEHPLTRALRATLNCDFRLCRGLAAGALPSVGLSICAICRPSA